MSTKIHNGYLLRGVNDSRALRGLLARLRAALQKRALELGSRLAMAEAVRIVDDVAVGRMTTRVAIEGVPWTTAISSVRARQCKIKDSGVYDPEVDLSVALTVTPVKGFLIARLHAENPHLIKVFESFEEVKPFPYWDDADRPSGLSLAQWKRRGALWDKAAKEASRPTGAGVLITLVNETELSFFIDKDTAALIRPVSERSTVLAGKMIAEERMRFLWNNRTATSAPTVEELSMIYMGCLRWLQGEDGVARMKQKTKEVEASLNHSLSPSDLLTCLA